MSSLPDLKQIRLDARRRRSELTCQQQQEAALALFQRIRTLGFYLNCKRIAFYLAGDGEIDPDLLLQLAHKQGKHCYLPVMSRSGPEKLHFVRYRPGDKLNLKSNFVYEPQSEQQEQPSTLDLVIVPLVAFDARCFRVGMGKGYYDRTFAFKQQDSSGKPVLLGVAHECQRVDSLQPAPWDVQLDGVATPDRLYLPA